MKNYALFFTSETIPRNYEEFSDLKREIVSSVAVEVSWVSLRAPWIGHRGSRQQIIFCSCFLNNWRNRSSLRYQFGLLKLILAVVCRVPSSLETKDQKTSIYIPVQIFTSSVLLRHSLSPNCMESFFHADFAQTESYKQTQNADLIKQSTQTNLKKRLTSKVMKNTRKMDKHSGYPKPAY